MICPLKNYAFGTGFYDVPKTSAYIRKDLVAEFADAVRRYVNPKKGDAFCSRSELLQKLNELQKVIEQ